MSLFPPRFLRLERGRSSCAPGVAALAVVAFFLGNPTAWAQSALGLRPFPVGAQRGTLVIGQHPEITVNGRAERLSPGARIHGPDNLILVSSALVGQKLLVNFVREPNSLVHEVWILTPAEAATPLP